MSDISIQPTGAHRPPWVNKKISLKDCDKVKTMLRDLHLGTVCEEALCPNIGECFSRSQATFMILGKDCTRFCTFCGVKRGKPAPVDPQEPARVAEGVRRLGLRHAVITSVTRDDLPDGGAQAFIDTVRAIRGLERRVTIELLIPDLMFNKEALRRLVDSGPDILGHNIETVLRLYAQARRGADYRRSLNVLKFAKDSNSSLLTKSGIMLGLGETQAEVLEAFDDLAASVCDFLSIGQYLAPGRTHLPVAEYIRPEKFDYYKEKALAAGLRHVESGTYVRSSYHAAEYLMTNNDK